MNRLDKIKGCMIAGAIGDALGYEVEFNLEPGIFKRFGKDGIQEYELYDGLAIVSDDTQMAMFSANAMIYANANELDEIKTIRDSYFAWYHTQVNDYHYHDDPQFWIMNEKRLYASRAPGGTCLSAIQMGCNGTIEKPINRSKGCGGIMRIAPIALAFDESKDSKEVAMLCAKASALTHGHQLGYIPSAYLGYMIHKLIHGDKKIIDLHDETLKVINELFKDSKEKTYFNKLINKAVELALDEQNDLEAIHQLGAGWIAEETLAISLYCAIKYQNDFKKAITTSVNHEGDSDSTGAVCGNLLGAYLGYLNLPTNYIKPLEMKDTILQLATQLDS